MSMLNRFRQLYWCYFSKPKAARTLYRAVCCPRATSLVELGITDPDRSLRLIQLATRFSPDRPVCYTAIDPFDARREGQSPLTLKSAHRLFSATSAKIKLVPGFPEDSLGAVANTLLDTDLIVFAHDVALDPAARLWFFLPRLLHAESRILRHGRPSEEDLHPAFSEIEHAEIARLAENQTRRKVA